MTPASELDLGHRCPRCGAALPPVEALSAVGQRLAERATAAGAALDSMRLALPASLTGAVRELAAEVPLLARALACLAGRCVPGGAAGRANP